MRILVVGATGTVGSAVSSALEACGHAVIRAGRSSGDHRVDLQDAASIEALFEAVGPVDAVVCTAGSARFGPVQDLTDDDYRSSIGSKLMGQVNLVRQGLRRLPRHGSVTLTSGTLSRHPEPGTAAVAMVGSAVEAFVRAAALDLPDGPRVNVVSPGAVRETLEALGMDPASGTPAAEVAGSYVRAVEGDMSGQTLYVGE